MSTLLECDPTVVYAARLSQHLIERPAPPILGGADLVAELAPPRTARAPLLDLPLDGRKTIVRGDVIER